MPLATFPNSPAPAQDFVQTPPHFPEVPADIVQRFPSARTWNDELTLWYKQLAGALGDQQDSVTAVVNANDQALGDIVVRQGELTVMIETETAARIDADGILAQRIVTVSALAGSSSHITVQGSPPAGPALNDLWVNNTVAQTPVTYKWNGVAWIEVTVPISVAAVAAEQTARITADGYLEGKYTLTVIAGNVVTGMNITSASGGGTNISSVIFRATDFQIYNGVNGITMFSVSGSNVNLAGVLTVSTSGKIFTGTGTYGNSNTPFYVDSTSHFALGSNLTWDGTTLTITGSISATSGTIGGWNVNASTLSKNNAVLDSAGQLFLGTANDVVYLSATDATYRLWVGNVTAGSAAFSVTKTGAVSATNVTISQGAGVNTVYISPSASYFGSPAAGNFQFTSYLGNMSISSVYNGTAYGAWTVLSGSSQLSVFDASHQVVISSSGSITITPTVATNAIVIGSGTSEIDLTSSGHLVLGGDTTLRRSSAGVFIVDNDLTASNLTASNTLTVTISGSIPSLSSTTINVTSAYQISGTTVIDSSRNITNAAAGTFAGLVTFNGHALVNGNTNKLYFFNTTNGTYMDELNGIRLHGDSGHPIQIVDGAPLRIGDGSAGTPSLSFNSDTDTGWFWNSSGDMRASTNGTSRFVIRDAAIVLLVPLKFDTSQQNIGAETLQKYITAVDAAGSTIKLAIVA